MLCALDEGEHDAPDPPSSSSCWQVCALDEGAGGPPSSSLGRKRKRQKRECWQKLSMTHTESDVRAPGPALHPSNAKEANEEGKVKVNLTLYKYFEAFAHCRKAKPISSSWYIKDAFARSSQEWLHLQTYMLVSLDFAEHDSDVFCMASTEC